MVLYFVCHSCKIFIPDSPIRFVYKIWSPYKHMGTTLANEKIPQAFYVVLLYMYMCTYVYMYICICVCMDIYIYMCVCVCVCV